MAARKKIPRSPVAGSGAPVRKRGRPRKDAAKAPKAPKVPKAPKAAKGRVTKAPSAGEYLRDLRAMAGVEERDYAFASDPLAWLSPPSQWLSTGLLALDRLTGGGWPVGRIAEIAAWESVGKSTILDQSIGQAQRDGAVCVLIDSEQARDDRYTAKLGVDLDQLIVHKADTIEDGFTGIDRVLALQEGYFKSLAKSKKEPPPMLIVWDSIGGTPTKAERDGKADDSHVAVAARANRMNLRRIANRLAHLRAVLVVANQFYQTFGPFAKLTTYGGGGIRYFTSVRVWLARKAGLIVGGQEVGHVVEAKLRKTRVNRPRPPAEMGLIYGAGVHNAYTLYEWGKTVGVNEQHRWVQQKAGWSYLMLPNGEYQAFQQSYLGFSDVLASNPAVYAEMVRQYREEG